MQKMFLIPAPGLRVLDPDTGRPLPADGGEVPKSTYWLRRLASGEAVEAKAPQKTSKKQEA